MTERKRLRDWGLKVGSFTPGPFNAITDVEGIKVGNITMIKDDLSVSQTPKYIRTGITAIVPYPLNLERRLLVGSFFMHPSADVTGYEVIDDFAYLNSPIVLTNPFVAGRIYNAILTVGFGFNREIWPPIVITLDDSYLNAMDTRIITDEHLIEAVKNASSEKVEEGSVGAGVGQVAYGYKGGIGTSSRQLSILGKDYIIGALVATSNLHHPATNCGEVEEENKSQSSPANKKGNLAIVLATDIPLIPTQLKVLAQEGALSQLSFVSPYDGMVSLAFTTTNEIDKSERGPLTYQFKFFKDALEPLYMAARDAIKEAVCNALLMAIPAKGRKDREAKSIDIEALKKLFLEFA